jgi:SlyX protein
MSTDPDLDTRLTELEVKLSFTEDLVEELNRTVYRQQQQIEALQQDIRALRDQLQASLPAESRNPADEVPPHY